SKDINGEALTVCILNKLCDQLQVTAVKVPRFSDNCKFILGDLTILTGGTIFTDKLDVKLEKSSPDLLNSSSSITITKEDTVVFNGKGSKDAIQAHCEQICTLLADLLTIEYDKTKLQEHFAKLSEGAAVIKAGDGSNVDVGKKKDRYNYPLNAEHAAVKEGILPGSSVASLKASL
ncbi:GroEL-like apical domain-containing protein, partial [Pisolithus tinctorius]